MPCAIPMVGTRISRIWATRTAVSRDMLPPGRDSGHALWTELYASFSRPVAKLPEVSACAERKFTECAALGYFPPALDALRKTVPVPRQKKAEALSGLPPHELRERLLRLHWHVHGLVAFADRDFVLRGDLEQGSIRGSARHVDQLGRDRSHHRIGVHCHDPNLQVSRVPALGDDLNRLVVPDRSRGNRPGHAHPFRLHPLDDPGPQLLFSLIGGARAGQAT